MYKRSILCLQKNGIKIFIIGTLILGFLSLVITGCEGPMGPEGLQGETGPQGEKEITCTHNWSNWIPISNAAVTTDGLELKTCTSCGNISGRIGSYATGNIPDDYFALITTGNYANKAYQIISGSSALPNELFIPAYRLYNNEYLPVIYIGSLALGGKTNLTSITLPETLLSIDWLALQDNPNLINITVNENNPNFSSQGGVLYNKEKTRLIAVAGGLSGTLTIPDTVTGSMAYAFRGCSSLTNIILGTSFGDLGNVVGVHRFDDCTSLLTINVNENNPYFSSQNGVLYNKSKSKIIAFPQGIQGEYTVPTSVTNIGDGAFKYCKKITGLILPVGLIAIESRSLWGCSNITNITIPASVTFIGDLAFANWNSTQTMYIQGHASKELADAAWGTGWNNNAVIWYWGNTWLN